MYRSYGSKGRQGARRTGRYPKFSKKTSRSYSGAYQNPKQGISAWGNKGAAPIRAELKYADYSFGVLQNNTDSISAGTMTLGGAKHSIANLTIGNDYNQRIGRKVTWKSIQLIGCICRPLANRPVNYRMMIIQDMQTNGAMADTTSILQGIWASTNATTQAARVFATTNPNYRARFKVLYDKHGTFGANFCGKLTGDVVTGDVGLDNGTQLDGIPVRKYIKLNIDTIYGAAGGAIADIASNGLILLLASDGAEGDPLGPSEEPYYCGQLRLRYVDA